VKLRAAALLLALLTALALAQPPRHVNPDEVKVQRPDPLALTSAYQLLTQLLRSQNFTGARGLAKLLMNASAPGDLAYALSRFHQLVLEEGELLNSSRTLLDLARRAAERGDLDAAKSMLGEALRALAKANATRYGLEEAAREIERRLRASATPVAVAVAELIRAHAGEARDVNASIFNLEGTAVTVEAPSEAWVGSMIEVSGLLVTSSGEPLPSRKVTVVVDGAQAGSELTDEIGHYSIAVKVPFVYRDRLSVVALYLPEGVDAQKYRASASDPVYVKLLFTRPSLSVSLNPREALPGSEVKVRIDSNVSGIRVTIAAFGLARSLTLNEFEGELVLKVPESAVDGLYKVVARSTPNGTIGPGEAVAELVVSRIALKVEKVEVPTLSLAPLPFPLRVCVSSPNVTLPGRYKVEAALLGARAEAEASGECVGLALAPPLLSPTGPARLEVTVTPLDPRFKPASTSAEVRLLNLLLLAFSAALLVPAAFRLRRGFEREEEVPPPKPVEAAQPEPEAEPVAYSESLKPEDPAILEYVLAVRAVEKASGVLLKPSHTISEYLEAVKGGLGPALDPFERLSRLAEARLYAGVEVDPELARTLRGELEKLLGGAG
jgi:hypothetical protein